MPQPARHPSPTAKAQRLAHLIFERPDLQKAEAFLRDFGLVTCDRNSNSIFMRGSAEAPFCYEIRKGKKAQFLGFGLEVESREALEALSRIKGAKPIQAIATPGGGEVVRLTDPNGFLVEAVFGQTYYEEIKQREPLTLNTNHVERVNAVQRVAEAPSQIIKLGHVVLETAEYQQTCAWYTAHLGLIPSDVQVLPDGSPFVTFFRFDLGDTPADHHSIAIGQGFCAQYNHSAFEVLDQDAVGMGQQVLRNKGYNHAWGIGRHILGSQIFDYWEDPWGFKHEHYCDGDRFTEDSPMGVSFANKQGLYQWGAPLPAKFIKPKINFANVIALLKNLRKSPDLSMTKLLTMAKTML
ncbi:MAG: VOC family protein [Pseudomonadales bacterium]|nr:VOC family protein [Pseudomonadales bacterium]